MLNSKGKEFIPDLVAYNPTTKEWVPSIRRSAGADFTPNQQVGYPELEGTVGAVLNTDKLEKYGLYRGNRVYIKVVFDAWECPSCAP
ncbi:hypothetical protein [Actinoplanes sp. NPDC049681]|uniref:hypothetical protein n=1 Tax=Actinoplanes sp. NPDC049681 TaxID=3363905 RepID=UPI00379B2DBD